MGSRRVGGVSGHAQENWKLEGPMRKKIDTVRSASDHLQFSTSNPSIRDKNEVVSPSPPLLFKSCRRWGQIRRAVPAVQIQELDSSGPSSPSRPVSLQRLHATVCHSLPGIQSAPSPLWGGKTPRRRSGSGAPVHLGSRRGLGVARSCPRICFVARAPWAALHPFVSLYRKQGEQKLLPCSLFSWKILWV